MKTAPTPRLPLAALSSLLVAFAPSAAAQGPPSSVRTDAVRVAELQERRLCNGDVRALRRAEVASEEGGPVLALAVREGAHVRAGDLLVRLDAGRLELELALLEAQRGVAQAQLDERERGVEQEQRDLAAVEELAARNAANAKEVLDARTALATANARLAQAQAELEVLAARVALLRDRLSDTEVRAPFAGTVARLATEVGQWVESGDPVLELVSDELEVWLQVPQRHLAALRQELGPLALRLGDAASPIDCERWRVVPVVDPVARMLSVVAALPAAPGAAPGMSATAWVPTGELARRPTVAVDALLRNELGSYLFVASPPAADPAEGQPWSVRPVQVELLWLQGQRAVVSGPLAAGERVVVEGKERLYPGAAVIPVDGPLPEERVEDGAPRAAGGRPAAGAGSGEGS